MKKERRGETRHRKEDGDGEREENRKGRLRKMDEK